MAHFAALDPRFFNGVDLEEVIELSLVSPGTVVVVIGDLAGASVDHNWIGPVSQPDNETGGLAAEELTRTGDRWGRLEASTSGVDGWNGTRGSVLIVTIWDKDVSPSYLKNDE